MMRLEILNPKNEKEILSTHRLSEGLTLLGRSPGATVQVRGKDIGPLHVALKATKHGVIIMDLGGPTRLRVDGKETLEALLEKDSAEFEIGKSRFRVVRGKKVFTELQKQEWVPVTERRERSKSTGKTSIRVRLYSKGIPQDVVQVNKTFTMQAGYGLISPHRLVWIEGNSVKVQLPSEWINLKGRIQCGKDKILPLEEWKNAAVIDKNTVYRITAGQFTAEILITDGHPLIIGSARSDVIAKELRKPMAVSALSMLLIFLVSFLLTSKEETKVEEPYPVYARIQNVPVEKILEPEPSNEPEAGGGSGSNSAQNTAPTIGGASAPSKLAASLTGGLRNLVGSVLSQTKATNAVVSETGVAAAAGGVRTSNAVGKLAAVGSNTAGVAGATKLGNLAIAGSGKGFGGGSGMGLGTGHGNGIGTGVGDGIGRGSYKLIEEESIVDGGLDKSVIAAVIQNNLSQIKYCYERQLVAEPDLFGKVVMRWMINGAGKVENTSVKQTTLNSSPVEQCMTSKISGWTFPQPKNGAKVTVTYPFLFKSTK